MVDHFREGAVSRFDGGVRPKRKRRQHWRNIRVGVSPLVEHGMVRSVVHGVEGELRNTIRFAPCELGRGSSYLKLNRLVGRGKLRDNVQRHEGSVVYVRILVDYGVVRERGRRRVRDRRCDVGVERVRYSVEHVDIHVRVDSIVGARVIPRSDQDRVSLGDGDHEVVHWEGLGVDLRIHDRETQSSTERRAPTPSTSIISMSWPSIQKWNIANVDVFTTRRRYVLPGWNGSVAFSLKPTFPAPLDVPSMGGRYFVSLPCTK
jgi:hypothetical protein